MTRHKTILEDGAANCGQVFRGGDTDRRPLRPNSATIHDELLLHLEDVGFDRAPGFLGIDSEGREVLAWIDGGEPLPPFPKRARTEASANTIAALLRELHQAGPAFRASQSAQWSSHVLQPWAGCPLLCHNEAARTNVVFRGRALSQRRWDADPSWFTASRSLKPDTLGTSTRET